MKKELNKIIMFIGFAVMVVGWIIAAASEVEVEDYDIAITYTVVTLANIAAILAIAFVFAKNGVVKNVGYALSALVGAEGVGLIVNGSDEEMVAAIGAILMLVAAVLYFFVVCLKFFGFVKGGEKAATSNNIAAVLTGYKEMKEEEVITEEEFNGLKQKLFDGTEQKVNSVDDLKKWKKLLDQKVITDEEFSKIKSDIFAK